MRKTNSQLLLALSASAEESTQETVLSTKEESKSPLGVKVSSSSNLAALSLEQ
jgi:hypothetical protein